MTTKDLKIAPGAQKSWSLDWGAEGNSYLQPGETVTSHTVAVYGGLTKVSDSLVGSVVTVTVAAAAGLREGQRPSILISIVTSSTPPRRDTRRIPLTCAFGAIA